MNTSTLKAKIVYKYSLVYTNDACLLAFSSSFNPSFIFLSIRQLLIASKSFFISIQSIIYPCQYFPPLFYILYSSLSDRYFTLFYQKQFSAEKCVIPTSLLLPRPCWLARLAQRRLRLP